mgnify:CR=1 FL=1
MATPLAASSMLPAPQPLPPKTLLPSGPLPIWPEFPAQGPAASCFCTETSMMRRATLFRENVLPAAPV